MSHAPLTELPLPYQPDAVPTAIGWGHPDTGEQLVSMRGLANPVDYYRPNSGPGSYFDPDIEGPANTAAPAITGNEEVGETLTASTGTWTGAATITYSYQWFRNGITLSGQTESTYELTFGDVGAMITVRVTAKNGGGMASAVSDEVGPVEGIAPVNEALPEVEGDLVEGGTVTTTDGVWLSDDTPTITYQWKKGGVNVDGETADTFVPATAGADYSVDVTATNDHGSTTVNSGEFEVIAA